MQTILADAAAKQSKVTDNAFFDGKAFLLLGEADAPQVASTIRRFGGVVVQGELESDDLDVDFVIVRLARRVVTLIHIYDSQLTIYQWRPFLYISSTFSTNEVQD